MGLLDISKLLFDAMLLAHDLPGAQRHLEEVLEAEISKPAAPLQRLMQAATLMSERRSAVLVAREGCVAGILTPKDLLFRGVAAGLAADTSTVEEVMTADPDLLPGSATVMEALHQLSSGGYRTVAVADAQSRPVGVLDVLSLLEVAFAQPLSSSADDTPSTAMAADRVDDPPMSPQVLPAAMLGSQLSSRGKRAANACHIRSPSDRHIGTGGGLRPAANRPPGMAQNAMMRQCSFRTWWMSSVLWGGCPQETKACQ